MAKKKDYIPIPIDSDLSRFYEHIKLSSRSILSARFGDGKSYFLSEFIKKYKSYFLFIPIYPVNYQIADNKDVIEYIKRDILVRLLMVNDITIDDTQIKKSLLILNFISNNKFSLLEDVLQFLPKINIPAGEAIPGMQFDIGKTVTSLRTIVDKFNSHIKNFKTDTAKYEEFIKEFNEQKGSIYELDAISQLICDIIDNYRKRKKKKVVLIIEDLDRIDPEHIFRILNIFSSHFDSYNIPLGELRNEKYDNKYKFDKVITVCHYENIQNIYSHFYGPKTDFLGYISKFSPGKPYYYSLKFSLENYIKTHIDYSLQEYPNIISGLVNKIIANYSSKTEHWGNLRYINNCLFQKSKIDEEKIYVMNEIAISSSNPFTRLIELCYFFDVDFLELYGDYKDILKSEMIKLIGVCWLIFNLESFVEYNLTFSLSKFHTRSVAKIGNRKFTFSYDIEYNYIKNLYFDTYDMDSLSEKVHIVYNYFSGYINNKS